MAQFSASVRSNAARSPVPSGTAVNVTGTTALAARTCAEVNGAWLGSAPT